MVSRPIFHLCQEVQPLTPPFSMREQLLYEFNICLLIALYR